MKSRKIKEIAKKYIRMYIPEESLKKYGRFEWISFQAYTDGRPPVYKYMFVPNSGKLSKAIFKEAYNLGWDGCHWNDPLLVKIDDDDLRKYEEENCIYF